MPPPKIPPPQFSPIGRYIIDVRERWYLDLIGHVVFHDTEHFTEECGIANIPSDSASRFNGLQWALYRGFVQCSHCKEPVLE